jgi:hypothetical protein
MTDRLALAVIGGATASVMTLLDPVAFAIAQRWRRQAAGACAA